MMQNVFQQLFFFLFVQHYLKCDLTKKVLYVQAQRYSLVSIESFLCNNVVCLAVQVLNLSQLYYTLIN